MALIPAVRSRRYLYKMVVAICLAVCVCAVAVVSAVAAVRLMNEA